MQMSAGIRKVYWHRSSLVTSRALLSASKALIKQDSMPVAFVATPHLVTLAASLGKRSAAFALDFTYIAMPFDGVDCFLSLFAS